MKIKSTKALITILSVIFAVTSCSKNEIETVLSQTNTTSLIDDGNRAARPVILGMKLNNPYSVENMKAALDTLKAHPEQHSTCLRAPGTTLDDIIIEPTDLYVRFLPVDSTQFVKLMTDTTLILFDYPLDYQKIQTGDYYKDPTVEGKYTWLYASVTIGYQPPAGIRYEIIEKLFIPEHSPYYSQEDASANVKGLNQTKALAFSKSDYTDALKTLEAVSFIITGNADQLNKPTTGNTPTGMQKATRYVKKTFLWTSWYEAVYNPEGYIKVSTPYGDQSLANIRVRVARYFTAYETRTNLQGKFYFYDQFGQDAIFPNIEYFVYFDGYKGVNSWKLCDALFGAAILWTTGISIGVHSPDNYSMTFNTSSYYWGECIQYNAIYKYNDIAGLDGITPPLYNLEIATLKTDEITVSSAPLFKNHIDVTNVLATFLQLYGILPDLILRYTNSMSDYNKINYFAWHELTHASQVQSMIDNNGYWWASGYWGANAGQQASNSIFNGGRPYGNKGDANWQIIALSEGWANYREWLLTKNYLYYDKGISYSFPINYGYMYKDLVDLGCSYTNIEKSLASYTVVGFRDNLISLYPNLKDMITTTIQPYE